MFWERSEEFSEDARLELIEALARRVEELHAVRFAHGDLKPANILVDPAAPNAPVIVDLVDFSTANDGDTVTARYAPESGGRYERDCFAVTVIAEELLAGTRARIFPPARKTTSNRRTY